MDSDPNDDSDADVKRWDTSAPVITSTSSFDAYFLHASARPRTSTNVFSSLILPLTPEEYAKAITTYKARSQTPQHSRAGQTRWTCPLDEQIAFRRYTRELAEGFNLLFYGFGSKRVILNKLATKHLSKRGHVVVVNGFQPNITLKDIVASIERVPGVLLSSPFSAGRTAEKQTQRLYDFFSEASHDLQRPHLYLVVHNIDSPAMRSTKIKNLLSLFALNPNIHLIASLDRLNAPLLWSSSEITARKSSCQRPGDAENQIQIQRHGYSWLWHDLTTLAPYDFELTYADRSSISGAAVLSIGGRSARQDPVVGGVTAGGLSETAVAHVLAAVTAKAKKLFTLFATKQIENMETVATDNTADLQQYGLTYDTLFSAARDAFIATNDTSLRSLLGEFRDHSLILSLTQGAPGGGEMLWIPLRQERLLRTLRAMDKE